MSTYFEVTIHFPSEIEGLDIQKFDKEIMENFNCQGIEEFNMEEARVDEILGEKSYCGGDVTPEILGEIENSKNTESSQIQKKYFFESFSEETNKFITTFFPSLSIEIKEKKNEDWNSNWKENFHKIVIDDNFNIIPSWEEKINSSDILIYPGMGFGTGTHETTFLCLQIVKQLLDKETIKTCFDHGCGSGILGIAFKSLSRESDVTMYDIDPQATENSLQNIEINDMTDQVDVVKPDNKNSIKSQYDLVFANILLYVLEQEVQFLASRTKQGGYLVLSGILNNQVEELLNIYNKDFEFVDSKSKNDWSAVLMKKR